MKTPKLLWLKKHIPITHKEAALFGSAMLEAAASDTFNQLIEAMANMS